MQTSTIPAWVGLDHTCMGSCCLLSISGWELHLGSEFCISYVHPQGGVTPIEPVQTLSTAVKILDRPK